MIFVLDNINKFNTKILYIYSSSRAASTHFPESLTIRPHHPFMDGFSDGR